METALQQPSSVINLGQLIQLGPVLVLIAAALVVIVLEVLLRVASGQKRGLGLVAGAGIAVGAAVMSLIWTVYLWLQKDASGAFAPQHLFTAFGPENPSVRAKPDIMQQFNAQYYWTGGALLIDHFALFVCIAVCFLLALVALILVPHLVRTKGYRMEIIALLILSSSGMMLLGMSRDLLITFISIEILSLPLYILCGMDDRRALGRESSLKYFLLGAFASGFLIYGIALIYGLAGNLNYEAIINYIRCSDSYSPMLLVGMGLIGVGLAFKLALVPFHAWVPDVYQGAPTPITAFMAVGVKIAVFAAAARFIIECWMALPVGYWRDGVALFACLSMLIGNLFALHQMSAKRLLAYSAIAHSGYLALALCTSDMYATKGILVYLVGYGLASLGAFTLISYLAPGDQDDIYMDELHELSRRAPVSAVALTILLLSMAGFPLTAGFVGKLVVFTDAWKAGLHGLVIYGVLNSVIGVYYYLRFVLAMYMQPKAPGAEEYQLQRMSAAYAIPSLIAVVLTLLIGILPGILLDLVQLCHLGG